jgi:hypothetical protein
MVDNDSQFSSNPAFVFAFFGLDESLHEKIPTNTNTIRAL